MADKIIRRVTQESARIWFGLNVRERKLVFLLFCLLSCLIYYFILIAPAQMGVRHLNNNLMVQRQTLSIMHSMAQDMLTLHQHQQAILRDPKKIEELILGIAQKHGLQGLQVTNVGDVKHHRWQLSGKNITFSDWIALLEELHQKTLLEVDVLTAIRSLEPGQVNLIAELQE